MGGEELPAGAVEPRQQHGVELVLVARPVLLDGRRQLVESLVVRGEEEIPFGAEGEGVQTDAEGYVYRPTARHVVAADHFLVRVQRAADAAVYSQQIGEVAVEQCSVQNVLQRTGHQEPFPEQSQFGRGARLSGSCAREPDDQLEARAVPQQPSAAVRGFLRRQQGLPERAARIDAEGREHAHRTQGGGLRGVLRHAAGPQVAPVVLQHRVRRYGPRRDAVVVDGAKPIVGPPPEAHRHAPLAGPDHTGHVPGLGEVAAVGTPVGAGHERGTRHVRVVPADHVLLGTVSQAGEDGVHRGGVEVEVHLAATLGGHRERVGDPYRVPVVGTVVPSQQDAPALLLGVERGVAAHAGQHMIGDLEAETVGAQGQFGDARGGVLQGDPRDRADREVLVGIGHGRTPADGRGHASTAPARASADMVRV